MKFNHMLDIAHLPQERRIFLVGQHGDILSLPDDTSGPSSTPASSGSTPVSRRQLANSSITAPFPA